MRNQQEVMIIYFFNFIIKVILKVYHVLWLNDKTDSLLSQIQSTDKSKPRKID